MRGRDPRPDRCPNPCIDIRGKAEGDQVTDRLRFAWRTGPCGIGADRPAHAERQRDKHADMAGAIDGHLVISLGGAEAGVR